MRLRQSIETPLVDLTALPRPPAGFEGPTSYFLLLRKGRGGKRGGEERGGRRREERGGLSGNVAEEAFCLKSVPDKHIDHVIVWQPGRIV